jgi:Uma2 family endonuclease
MNTNPRRSDARTGQLIAFLIRRLGNYIEPRSIGWLFTSRCGYQCFAFSPNLIHYPSISFVRRERLLAREIPDGHLLIPPDLAVEFAFPNDRAEEIEERVKDYLRAGVPLVWVVYPRTGCVRVLRQGGKATQLTGAEELTGEEVLPGFSCSVEQLFTKD